MEFSSPLPRQESLWSCSDPFQGCLHTATSVALPWMGVLSACWREQITRKHGGWACSVSSVHRSAMGGDLELLWKTPAKARMEGTGPQRSAEEFFRKLDDSVPAAWFPQVSVYLG